jgi:hypothetical protein
MKLTIKGIADHLGLRVRFETAPVEKFHVQSSLVSPNDAYRYDVTITLPENKPEKWLDGTSKAIDRVEGGDNWAIRLEYDNAIQYFTVEQLQQIAKKQPSYSMTLHNTPPREIRAEEARQRKRAFALVCKKCKRGAG